MRSFRPNLGPGGNLAYRFLRGRRQDLVRRFEWSLEHPQQAQEARLAHILARTAGAEFGREHGLSQVRSLADLRAAVPIRDAAAHGPWLDRVAAGERGVLSTEPTQMLLETSGTTGAPKHLPVTESWAQGVADAQWLWVLAMVRDNLGVTEGKALTVVSPEIHGRSPGGLPIGSNTGRMHRRQPWYLRARYPVPYSVYLLPDVALKHYVLLRFALQADIRSITTANPSTLLLLARRLQEWAPALSQDVADGTLRCGPAAGLSPGQRRRWEWRLRRAAVPQDWRPAALWRLAQVNCWRGGPAAYFVSRLPHALGLPVPIREVGLTASEGFFAIPLGFDWGGGALWNLGHVLEFIGEDGAPRWAWELEPGERLRLVVTTEAGLFRYDLQDDVEVIGRCGRTPVVRFVGKSGRWLNAVGEKVSGGQVSLAVADAARETGLHPTGFTARLVWGEVPHQQLALEGLESDSAAEAFAAAYEQALRRANVEFADRRQTERLGPVQAHRLPPGTYLRHRVLRVQAGAPEGQVKDPIIATTEAEWARIERAAAGP